MRNTLADIRAKLTDGAYKNEEHVRLSLVARIIQKLGWDLWNPAEVNSEFAVVPREDQSRVDLALFLNAYSPVVFIEVKAVGKLTGNIARIEHQLRDYNRNNTALFSIITDGQKWRFYYSQTGGEFSQKRFKTLDLLQDDIDEVQKFFDTFLSKTEISNGNAEREAKNYLQMTQRQRAMEDVLPKARRLVLEPPFLSLPEAVVQLTKDAGYSVTMKEATDFIQKNERDKDKIPPDGDREEERPDTHQRGTRNRFYKHTDRIEIILNSPHSANKYHLIPLSVETRSFFPGYKIPFILETDVGEIETNVTADSQDRKTGDPEAGKYISKGMAQWYRSHGNLKAGDKLVIRVIEPKKRYRLNISE